MISFRDDQAAQAWEFHVFLEEICRRLNAAIVAATIPQAVQTVKGTRNVED